MDANGVWYGLMNPPRRARTLPKVLIIGAGSRGHAYAEAISTSGNAIVHAIAEPIAFKREEFGNRYIWAKSRPKQGQSFDGWKDFLQYEKARRELGATGHDDVEEGVDAAFICTLDEQHAEIITALATLQLHLMCEKPLATSLDDCLHIYHTLLSETAAGAPSALFGIGHVLRYSPHNMLLRDLLLTQRVIGDTISIEHTEPVGWWHFSHSYVRGNWRKESKTAPSLLTKSCHDIDLILWLLSSPPSPTSRQKPHLPARITSVGNLSYFRKLRKPIEAGNATNCLSCQYEPQCEFSAKQLYVDRFLRRGVTGWPVKIIDPEIEDIFKTQGVGTAEKRLLQRLAEDYDRESTPQENIDVRPWYGRCVWEADNDVCDDQIVTLTWDDDVEPSTTDTTGSDEDDFNRFSKSATFHMIAQTEAQCERRGRIYGTKGEITYDSKTIRVFNFASGEAKVYHPAQLGGGHGGGDAGLADQFIQAVAAVKKGGMSTDIAQRTFIGCTLDDIIRSHALVFAAEEARRESKVLDWKEWWNREVDGRNGWVKV